MIELTELCTKHNIVDLYLWLSNRFPGSFVERDIVVKHKAPPPSGLRVPI